MKEGNSQDALKALEMLEKSKQLSEEDYLACKYLKSSVFLGMEEFSRGLSATEELLEESRKAKSKLRELDALLNKIILYMDAGKISDSSELLEATEVRFEQNEFHAERPEEIRKREAKLLIIKGHLYAVKANFDQALIFSQQGLSRAEEIGNKSLIADALHIMGGIYQQKGELGQAIEWYHQSLTINEKNNDHRSIAATSANLALAYHHTGELNKALTYYQQSLSIVEKMENEQALATLFLNIGGVYSDKGDLNEANKYYNRCLAIATKIGNQRILAYVLLRLSDLLVKKNEASAARSSIEETLKITQDMEDSRLRAYALYYYVRLVALFSLAVNTDAYIAELQTISEGSESRLISQYYRLAKAMVLKTSIKPEDIATAQLLLRQIADEEIVHQRLTVEAMISLANLLFSEVRSVKDQNLINELAGLSENLQAFADAIGSTSASAESYFLRAKLATHDLDLDKARELLTQAHDLAMEKGLNGLTRQISSEHLNLLSKGATPLRILIMLLSKGELSLRELSETLNLTKAGVARHLKLLIQFELVEESREEQVRGPIKAKYYQLGPKGSDIFQPVYINLLESYIPTDSDVLLLENAVNSYRMNLLIWQNFNNLITTYMDFLEKQAIPAAQGRKCDELLSKEDAFVFQKMLKEENEIEIEQYFLTDDQYKIYRRLWQGFSKKVQKEVFEQESEDSAISEKTKYVLTTMLPLKELLELERMKEKNEKAQRKKKRENKAS
jgi:tetratricopeptide (TPR) repeat protein/predicted ArsR family transcriptional regulator